MPEPTFTGCEEPLGVKENPKTYRRVGGAKKVLSIRGMGQVIRHTQTIHIAAGGPPCPVQRSTQEYKLDPIRRKVRELHEAAGRRPVEQWLGISLDEIGRMRTSDVRYITHRYPLVEGRMTRWDCQRWLQAHGWTDVPKSSCIGCPFHADRQWRELRDRSPEEWADAVAFDQAIRGGHVQPDGKVQLLGEAYLHSSLVPLAQADLSTPEDRGQLNLFEADCQSGVCGL
jgi:hypothetical protein